MSYADQVFRANCLDILQSGVIPSIHLTDIFRQSETSRIVTNAHRINEGKMPLLNEKNTDFFFERQMSLQQAADTIVAIDGKKLGKPHSEADARAMLHLLSGRTSKAIFHVLLRQLHIACLDPIEDKLLDACQDHLIITS